jgi:hypothetical protein
MHYPLICGISQLNLASLTANTRSGDFRILVPVSNHRSSTHPPKYVHIDGGWGFATGEAPEDQKRRTKASCSCVSSHMSLYGYLLTMSMDQLRWMPQVERKVRRRGSMPKVSSLWTCLRVQGCYRSEWTFSPTSWVCSQRLLTDLPLC